MSRPRTTFLLGAGASSPYGFPLGPDLKGTLQQVANNGSTQKRLIELGIEESLIRDFNETLQFGTYSTIDEFLDVKARFRELGSLLIAESLLPKERHEILFPSKNWYKVLFDRLDFTSSSRVPEEIAFVTLNYDRSLEHFLNRTIDYNLRDDAVEPAHTVRKKIKIIHAHGSLGAYPDVPYGDRAVVNAQTIRAAAESIKIVSDRMEDSNLFQAAKKELADSERVVFVGFGYHPVTLEALFAGIDTREKIIMGTSVKLHADRKASVSEFFHGGIQLHEQDSAKFIAGIDL